MYLREVPWMSPGGIMWWTEGFQEVMQQHDQPQGGRMRMLP